MFRLVAKLSKQGAAVGASLLLLIAYPLPALAQTGSDAQSVAGSSQSSSGNTGPQAPTGPDAKTYSYNSSTGLWENDYYTWNPVTKQTAPKLQQSYSYNPTTGHWDTTQWIYDASQGKYVAQTVEVSQLPEGALVKNAQGNGSQSAETPANSASSDISSAGVFDLFYDVSISNNLESAAQSGDAVVANNTRAGDAISGNAITIANLINMLQSASNFGQGGNFSAFIYDVSGDVQGDILIDPSALASATANQNNNILNGDVVLNSGGSGIIENNISLTASSGNANVNDNTQAGNATSGNAGAMANVVNLINSIVNSGQSFLGVVNIYGNLEGNILLPADFLDSLLASNTPITVATTASTNLTNTQNINNIINMTATTGMATVTNNTSAGNAATGTATTNLTLLNLTGQQVIGSNSLLVFVNVLGNWVGLIMDAPPGTTAAELGGDITKNALLPANLDADNSVINNNISVAATSGNASVANNTSAGNATSGNAQTGVNLLNISYSSLSLTDWLGILFINVFGSWNGNLGLASPRSGTAVSGSHASAGVSNVLVFRFIPSSSNGSTSNKSTTENNQSLQHSIYQLAPMPASALTDNLSAFTPSANKTKNNEDSKTTSLFWVVGSLGTLSLIGATQRAVERYRSTANK